MATSYLGLLLFYCWCGPLVLGRADSRLICVDGNGVEHLVNSTWRPRPWCECKCHPLEWAGSLKVFQACDKPDCEESDAGQPLIDRMYGFLGRMPSQDYPTGLYGLPRNFLRNGRNSFRDRAITTDCVYAQTGLRYLDGERWLSLADPCSQCQCQAGHVHCSSREQDRDSCPKLGLLTGTHCEHNNGSLSMATDQDSCCRPVCPRDTAVFFTLEQRSKLACPILDKNQMLGDVQIIRGTCHDKVCTCQDGEWICRETCLDMESEQARLCNKTQLVMFDPFCCPRCTGKESCIVSEGNESPAGFSTFHEATQCFCLSGRMHCAGKNRLVSVATREEQLTPRAESRDASACTIKLSHWNEWKTFARGDRWTEPAPNCHSCQCLGRDQFTCQPIKCQSSIDCALDELPVFKLNASDPETSLCCPSECKLADTQYLLDTPDDRNARIDLKAPAMSSIEGKCQVPRDVQQNEVQLVLGSRLIVKRACKSLFCECQNQLWSCFEFCPDCQRDLSQALVQVPKQESHETCCPLCRDDSNTLTNVPGSGSSEEEDYWKKMCLISYLMLGILLAFGGCLMYGSWHLRRTRGKLTDEAERVVHNDRPLILNGLKRNGSPGHVATSEASGRFDELQRKFISAREKVSLLNTRSQASAVPETCPNISM